MNSRVVFQKNLYKQILRAEIFSSLLVLRLTATAVLNSTPFPTLRNINIAMILLNDPLVDGFPVIKLPDFEEAAGRS